jgi:hypothetical protein
MPSLTSRCWRANKPAGSAVPLSKEEARLGVRKPGSRIAVTSAAVGVDGCRAEYLTAVKSESSYVKRLRRSPKTLHRPTALGLCSKKPGVARRSKRRFNSGANLSIYTAQRIWVPSGQCVPSTEKEFGSHLWRLVGSTQSTPTLSPWRWRQRTPSHGTPAAERWSQGHLWSNGLARRYLDRQGLSQRSL